VPPSPNDQFQLVGDLIERSVNVTSNGAVPTVGVPVKSATGAGVILVIVNPFVSVPVWPSGLVTLTFHCPTVAPAKLNIQVIFVEPATVTSVAAISG